MTQASKELDKKELKSEGRAYTEIKGPGVYI